MPSGIKGADYEFQPSFILGFHGCEREVGEKILSGMEPDLKASEREYDWLGSGIYFWEGNLTRAWAWAEQRMADGKIGEPFVLGAIIDLKHCLDLFSSEAMQMVRPAHAGLEQVMASAGQPMPQNVGQTPDKAGRKLERANPGRCQTFTPLGFSLMRTRPCCRVCCNGKSLAPN